MNEPSCMLQSCSTLSFCSAIDNRWNRHDRRSPCVACRFQNATPCDSSWKISAVSIQSPAITRLARKWSKYVVLPRGPSYLVARPAPTCLNRCECSSVATIFAPPPNNFFGPLAKGLRRLLLPGGPLRAPSTPWAHRGRGACGALATPLCEWQIW